MADIDSSTGRARGFWSSGHLPTLLTAFLYFDLTFAVWVLNAAMAPFISAELGLTDAQKGLMLAVPVLAGALLRLPIGIGSQIIGRKNAAMLNLALVAVGLAVGYLLVDSFTGVLVMGGLLGVAGASFGVALSLGAGHYPPRHKGLAMGIAGAGNSGAVLAMLFAPPLARAFGWQAVYGLAIIPMVVSMALLQIFAKEPPDRERQPWSKYLAVLVDRDAWVLNLVYMVTFGGYIGLTSFLPTLFHDQYGVPRQSVGQYAAGIVIAASVLRVAGGALADRFGGARLLVGLFVIIIGATIAAAALPASPLVMVVIMLVAFAAMGAGNGAVFQLVPLRFPGNTAVASGLIGEFGGLAGGLLPAAMGMGKSWTGSYAPGFGLLVVLAVASVVALALVSGAWARHREAMAAAAAAGGDQNVQPMPIRT
jgi:NNP family nitrate/nitrite transporter-like MFS transporter